MKRLIYALPVILLVFALLVSCSDEETNVADTLSVAAFYPTIVMEDTEVIITGTAMNQVTEVVFPGERAAKELTVLDDTRLKVTAPNGISTEPGSLILKTAGGEIISRQTIRAATPALNYMTPADVIETYADLNIIGMDFLLVDAVEFIEGNNKVEVKAMNFVRKSNSQVMVTVPENAPLGDNIQLNLAFKNNEIMNLGTMKIIKGNKPGGGHWESKEIIVYSGDPINIGAWAEWLTVEADKFEGLELENTLRVYFTEPGSSPQGGLRDGNWGDLAEGTNYFDLTDTDLTNGYYDWVVDEIVLEKLQTGGVIIGGSNYTVTKVVYVTQVWVEGGGEESLTDPITEATIMLNDYEQHGDHNASWDMSWADGEATEAVTDEATGNTYIRLVKDVDGWTLNCNHIDHGTVKGIENYVVKLDVFIEDGVTVPAEQGAQWVLADDWKWYGDGFIPETTNGKWITIRTECSELGLSGDIEFGTKTNGLAGKFPAGVCFDNLRLDPKE